MPTVIQIQNAAAALVAVGTVSSVLYGIFLAADALLTVGQRMTAPKGQR